MKTKPIAPRWMRQTLLAAGIYNVLWGAFAVLFPSAIFNWLNMPQPNYPQFWQCIGMIVGVYGLGYAIAAFDPARHWPIVLVGFLGKVFGPLGMVKALWTGELPWGFALNCVTNDLIWWIPFALILKYAWDQFQKQEDAGPLPNLATLLSQAKTTDENSLTQLSMQHPLLVVFLRHAGCTFCRETLADLSKHRTEIEAKGTRLALVHMGTAGAFAEFAGSYGLSDIPAVSDPERRLYRGIGLQRGKILQLLGWNVWLRGAQAFFSGHRVGKLEGDGTQMPGAFLLYQGRVVRSFIHKTAADRPDYMDLSQLPTAS
jgi:peroxiredoxin